MKTLLDPAFDPRHAAVIEGIEPSHDGVVPASSGPAGTADIVEESANRVRIRADLSHAGHLILCDTWYPGWIATVDGARAPILRANAMFRAVALGPGEHDVEFRYRPRSVLAGLTLSIVSMVLAAGVAVLAPRK